MSSVLYVYLVIAGFMIILGTLNYVLPVDSKQKVAGARIFFIGPVWPLAILAAVLVVVYWLVRGLYRMLMVAIKGEL